MHPALSTFGRFNSFRNFLFNMTATIVSEQPSVSVMQHSQRIFAVTCITSDLHTNRYRPGFHTEWRLPGVALGLPPPPASVSPTPPTITSI